ncbi:MAG: hypothetical protein AB1468_01760 [Candidatus Micrarchaeota archaeon]
MLKQNPVPNRIPLDSFFMKNEFFQLKLTSNADGNEKIAGNLLQKNDLQKKVDEIAGKLKELKELFINLRDSDKIKKLGKRMDMDPWDAAAATFKIKKSEFEKLEAEARELVKGDPNNPNLQALRKELNETEREMNATHKEIKEMGEALVA